ncbi:MAG: FAD-dependent oxidoreductase [Verrucomicrobiales bacterium]|nr:FAD-dependent oxidoreductase [Verrucomicrobiales bacterium]
MMRWILFALCCVPLWTAAAASDVVVYGATPGGFCAAIAAAREGAAVTLIEPTDHVGGVNTGGLCFSDSNQTMRSTVLGLFEEWHLRIEKDYQDRGVELPYQVAVKDHTHWTYEPHVAARVTAQMLAEAGVKVITHQPLQRVVRQGDRIARIETSAGSHEAAVFVDATYEGDLMAAAGVSWTIGREGRAEYGESLAGKQYPKAAMAMSGLDPNGGLLPLVTTSDASAEEEGDRNVMVYSFRLCVTKDPANRVPFPAPAHYNPARWEILRRYFSQEKRPHLLWDLYPLPGDKFDANNGIGKQFSMGFVGACNGWSEADAAERERIWEAHKQYTLEMYHFLTTDPAVPDFIREEYAQLGLCRDEFAATGHWSPQLYVREGRRMKGAWVLSQKDILGEPEKPDPIIVSSFPIDSHDCQRVGTAERVINEGTIFPVRMERRRHGYPYQVPYRAITPQATECANLLVPVALSCTHVGLSSIRVEPTWMILGQSAGIAAALCAREKVAVQQLDYPLLRERLLAQNQVLDLPVLPDLPPEPVGAGIDPQTLPGLVLDDAAAELRGPWSRSTNFKPHVGTGYLHDDRRGDGQSAAVFRFKAPKSGRYDLRMAYSAHETRATAVPVEVTSGGQVERLSVDQTRPLPTGEAFRTVGSVTLSSEGESTITVSNRDTDGFVILDALQLVESAP